MQNVAETHDTPVRAASGGPLRPGVVCVVQVEPDALAAIVDDRSATVLALRVTLYAFTAADGALRTQATKSSKTGTVSSEHVVICLPP